MFAYLPACVPTNLPTQIPTVHMQACILSAPIVRGLHPGAEVHLPTAPRPSVVRTYIGRLLKPSSPRFNATVPRSKGRFRIS